MHLPKSALALIVLGLLSVCLAASILAQSLPGSVIASQRPLPRPSEVPPPITVNPPAPPRPALFWNKVITTQKTYEGCMQSARTNGLTNVRVSSDEVAGTSLDGAVYVAITCVGRGADMRAVAFIAGVGQDLAFVRRIVESTAEQVRTAGVPD